MNNIFCIECEFELPSDANFCEKCGVSQEEDEYEDEEDEYEDEDDEYEDEDDEDRKSIRFLISLFIFIPIITILIIGVWQNYN